MWTTVFAVLFEPTINQSTTTTININDIVSTGKIVLLSRGSCPLYRIFVCRSGQCCYLLHRFFVWRHQRTHVRLLRVTLQIYILDTDLLVVRVDPNHAGCSARKKSSPRWDNECIFLIYNLTHHLYNTIMVHTSCLSTHRNEQTTLT